jgi:hypothetical protein
LDELSDDEDEISLNSNMSAEAADNVKVGLNVSLVLVRTIFEAQFVLLQLV